MLKKIQKKIKKSEDKLYHFLFVDLAQYYYLFRNGLLADNMIYTDLTLEEKLLLHKILKKRNDKQVCLEIGSFLGSSACFIANAISVNSKLFCIDTWKSDNIKYSSADPDEGKDTIDNFRKNTQKYKKKIIEVRAWSSKAIHTVKRYKYKIDFLFIDGDHHYQGVKTDWELYSPLLKSGSIIALHDTGWAIGVKRIIDEKVKKVSKKIAELPNLMVFKVK